MTKTTEKFTDAKHRFEAGYLDTLLRRFSNLRAAAKAAGMDHSTLWRLLRKHGYQPTRTMWGKP